MTLQPFFSNIFTLRNSEAVNFADIIKIVNKFIKKIFEDSIKVKRTINYVR